MTEMAQVIGTNRMQRIAGVDLRQPIAFLALLGLWLLTRPYTGIYGDALMYVTRAVADFDPDGVGRDWMFIMDEQSRFSVFRYAVRFAVAHLGTSASAKAFALTGLLFWYVCAFQLARTLATGRARWLILALVSLLPHSYGAFGLLPCGEASAIPRPFAEGLVLLSLAMQQRNRNFAAAALVVLAALLHPIMALAGAGVLFITLCQGDRRWLILLALGVIAVAAATVLGLPLATRLLQRVDPAWLEILRIRNPYLFPTQWDSEALSFLALRIATLVAASLVVTGPARTLFRVAAAVAVAGVGAATLFGDLIPNLLIVQVQLWRMAWITVVLAPAALAMLVVASAERQPSAWLAPALLALAWSPVDPVVRLALCGLAIAAGVVVPAVAARLSESGARLATATLVVAATAISLYTLAMLLLTVAGGPDSLFALRGRWLLADAHAWPLAVPATIVALRGGFSRDIRVDAALAAMLALAGAIAWDSRSDYRRAIDGGQPIPEFASIVATRPGEVYWAQGSLGAWYRLGRPNWLVSIQGAAIVFSREQALFWMSRAQRAVQLGFETDRMIQTFSDSPETSRPTLDAARLAAFCKPSDAPAWIVWPMAEAETPPADVSPLAIWNAPRNFAYHVLDGGRPSWERIDRFMLLPCRETASQKDGPGAQ